MDFRRLASLPLGALRAFDAVARMGSAKAAAERLNVSATAVSHQLRTLEEYLGTRLFERHHRELAPTRAGRRLAAATRAAFDGLADALEGLAGDGLIADRATLTVSAAPTFAAKWLAPRIHLFTGAEPGIELRLRAEGALTDPGADRAVDVAIRYGAGPFAMQLDATRLFDGGAIVCAVAPVVAATLREPVDLLQLVLLRTATPQTPADVEPICWTRWLRQAGVEGAAVQRAIARAPLFGTTQLALEAAMAGQGAALSPEILIADDLRSGRLVEPFGIRMPDTFAYWLLLRRDRANERRIAAFRSWLGAECAPCGSPLDG